MKTAYLIKGNSPQLSVRVPQELIDELEKLAASDRRKLSDYVRIVLTRHAEEGSSRASTTIHPSPELLNRTEATLQAGASKNALPLHRKTGSAK
jgi:Arc/MetJ-type ribon-helix-helix transcriptional regulator